MQQGYETITLETSADGVLTVTLNRPQVANALNTRMGHDLCDVFTALAHAPGAIRCAVLTGAGDRAFCGGADLKERNGMSDADWLAQHVLFERMFRAILDCPLPVIAAINGAAYAGGLEMTLCCDFSYAVRNARFALTEVTLGIMPGGCGTQTLPRTAGERRAKEIILTGEPFSAEQAYDWGIVNRLCEPGEVASLANRTAQRICANAPLSVRQAKLAIHRGLQMDLASGLEFEIQAYNRLVATDDRREGIQAFNEKRKPIYRGR
ncbi:MAG: enoyl-CoA hydratase/isomerase family protein [Burkholderiales bacterium]|nr:enoyl-CoA hydratase/isomerase family protein [Burkholderiales bacterium]